MERTLSFALQYFNKKHFISFEKSLKGNKFLLNNFYFFKQLVCSLLSEKMISLTFLEEKKKVRFQSEA